jgi:hypothetical protein
MQRWLAPQSESRPQALVVLGAQYDTPLVVTHCCPLGQTTPAPHRGRHWLLTQTLPVPHWSLNWQVSVLATQRPATQERPVGQSESCVQAGELDD